MSFDSIELKDLLKDKGYLRGPFGSALKRAELKDSGVPVYEQQHAISGIREFRYFIDDEKYQSLKRFTVSENDLIISCSGTVGRISIIEKEDPKGIISQALLVLRPDIDKITPHFLYYFLISQQGQQEILNASQGAVQLNIAPRAVVEKIPVPTPTRSEQDRIVGILKTIDDKVELNSKTNQTLEKIAQAIFKSWFVDFDPVKAKMETLAAGGSGEDAELAAMRVISAKSIDELNSLKANNPEAFKKLAHTAALFPAAMQDSELGEIPLGWKVSTLSSLIELTGGGTPKRSEDTYWNGDIPWFSVRDVPSGSNVFVVDTDEKITGLGLRKSSTKLLPKGTTIITARGTVGKLALVGTDMCMNQSCYGIRGKEVGDFYNYFNLKEAVTTLQHNTHGAVFDTITTKTFDTYSMAFSGTELANKFDEVVAPILQKIEANVRQNIQLSALRDSLLPKMLAGQL